ASNLFAVDDTPQGFPCVATEFRKLCRSAKGRTGQGANLRSSGRHVMELRREGQRCEYASASRYDCMSERAGQPRSGDTDGNRIASRAIHYEMPTPTPTLGP